MEAGGENGRRSAHDDTFSPLHHSQMLCRVVVLRNDEAGATNQEADWNALADTIPVCLQTIP
jgi:hypothetical protein